MSMQPQERVAELIDEAYAEMTQRHATKRDPGSQPPIIVDSITATDEFSALVSWPTPAAPETFTQILDLAVAAQEPR